MPSYELSEVEKKAADTIIKIDNKYTVVHCNGVGLRATRYGQPWRDLTGDGLVLAMAQEIEELREKQRVDRQALDQIEKYFHIETSLTGAVRISPK